MTAWSHSLRGIEVNGGIKIRFIKGIHKGLDRRLTDTDLVCNAARRAMEIRREKVEGNNLGCGYGLA